MTDRFRFDCSSCEIDIVVDAGVRTDILENGCPICGGAARVGDFERSEATQDRAS
ncbi:MAG: DUF7560 family zinc ribbon protein [Halanaeroarchaeum sp.]